jgi:alpha-beta hydrolase superfamily lysophospholipase
LVDLPGLEEHRIRTGDGLELGAWFFRPTGSRPSVLLLHGNGGSRASFAGLIPVLAREGFGVLAISMRAHGDSAGELNDFGLGAGRDVEAAVRFLERERPGRKVVIVGESLGAAAALFAARDCRGRVHGYLLAAPYGDLETAVWNRCDSRLVPPFRELAYAGLRLWAPVFLRAGVEEIRPCDSLRDLPEWVPVTIFASEADRSARIGETRSIAAGIRAPVRLVAVPEGGHGRFLALHEREYREEMLDLLERAECGD